MTNVSKTAELIKHLNDRQRLYRLSEPLEGHEYVVVSAAVDMFGPETYIFPSNANGNVTDYLELDGSFKGAIDHAKALRRAGYQEVETSGAAS